MSIRIIAVISSCAKAEVATDVESVQYNVDLRKESTNELEVR